MNRPTNNINNYRGKGLLGIAVTVVLTLACGLLYALNDSNSDYDDDDDCDDDFDFD